jgi:DNA-binding transcriptional MerR regulator
VSTVASERPKRIGELARELGTTPRTIRYYEEIGLLPDAGDRPPGQHRLYGEAERERLSEILRLRHLLGVSLEELRELLAAEEARAELRREYRASEDPARRAEILRAALRIASHQLELVHRREAELRSLSEEIEARRADLRERLAEIGEPS